jgi:hypothetical protein
MEPTWWVECSLGQWVMVFHLLLPTSIAPSGTAAAAAAAAVTPGAFMMHSALSVRAFQVGLQPGDHPSSLRSGCDPRASRPPGAACGEAEEPKSSAGASLWRGGPAPGSLAAKEEETPAIVGIKATAAVVLIGSRWLGVPK